MARIRYAIRTLSKAPLLSLVVILSLGLGIGANTAIFSLLHQVVLSSLPVPHPEQLVLLKYPGQFKGGSSWDDDSGDMDFIFDWRMFREFEKRTEAAQVVGFRRFPSNIAFARQTVSGSMMLVSGRYFSVLGVRPLVGRLIEPGDDISGGGNPVAVLAYRYWQEKLGGDRGVLNQTVTVNGQPFTVVGIAPPGFTGTTVGAEPSVYLPMSFKPHLTEGWDGTDRLDYYWVYLLARLNPGVALAQAETSLNAPYHAIAEEIIQNVKGFRKDRIPLFRQSKLTLVPGKQGNSGFREQYADALKILMAATGLVLLIAIANAANLLLARSAERRKELAVRAALGAGRGELMGQFLTEALLLSVSGGVAGLGIAALTIRGLSAYFAGSNERFASTGLDWSVLLFSLAVSLAAGLLVGLYPAWSAARTPLAAVLADETAKSSASRGARVLRTALVCAQVTISVILLIPTGLFVRSLVNLLHVDLGIRTENIVGFNITPQWNGYDPDRSHAIFAQAEEKLAAIPGVRSVVASSVPLIAGDNWGTSFRKAGMAPEAKSLNSKYDEIGPGFFATVGVPLIAGRDIRETDTAAAPKVIVVNQEFVKEFLGGDNPIGMMLGFGKNPGFDTQIVGVVKDSHYSSVRQKIPPVFYRPWRQDPKIGSITFYVRTAMPVAEVVPQIRAAMRQIDRNLPLDDMRTLDDQIHYNLRDDELALRLAGAFALLATLLAMLGLYGVMAHGVARRTREIGIRMALGAAPGRIRSLVMRELIVILAVGLGIGIPAALAGARLTASQLFGVKPNDAAVVAIASVLLAVTAAVAALLPAQRAASVNPLDALRHE